MVRAAGLGQLEKNYFILGVFHGKKQLFANSNLRKYSCYWFQPEAKWQVTQSTFLIGESSQIHFT